MTPEFLWTHHLMSKRKENITEGHFSKASFMDWLVPLTTFMGLVLVKDSASTGWA